MSKEKKNLMSKTEALLAEISSKLDRIIELQNKTVTLATAEIELEKVEVATMQIGLPESAKKKIVS